MDTLNFMVSPHFSLKEMLKSSKNPKNSFEPCVDHFSIVLNLRSLCQLILEPLRQSYSSYYSRLKGSISTFPVMIVNSGYRNSTTNTMVGGAKNSYHMKGLAADIRMSDGRFNEFCLVAEKFRSEHPYLFSEFIVYPSGFIHVALSLSSVNNYLLKYLNCNEE